MIDQYLITQKSMPMLQYVILSIKQGSYNAQCPNNRQRPLKYLAANPERFLKCV